MRLVFYGAMISEGVIALVWAGVALGYYGGARVWPQHWPPAGRGLWCTKHVWPRWAVFGGILAVLGVVVLPITSGDTAFRVGRLILADYFRGLSRAWSIAICLRCRCSGCR